VTPRVGSLRLLLRSRLTPSSSRSGAPVQWLIVGLGNPGSQYVGTPHNVGFEVAEALRDRWDLPKPKAKYRGQLTSGAAVLGTDPQTGAPIKQQVAILTPQTYMNESGKSVGPARGELKVAPDHVLVVHDEIDLPFGEIRTRLGGGLAGHNGLKSIKAELGTGDFRRVRIGVGRPDSTDPELVMAHVLGKFRESRAEVQDLIAQAADVTERSLTASPEPA
jgi:PTH1 family peptidyl-tRNA hydrolase